MRAEHLSWVVGCHATHTAQLCASSGAEEELVTVEHVNQLLYVSCCRANIRILVKDTVAAKNGYGPYVEPVSVDINSQGEQCT